MTTAHITRNGQIAIPRDILVNLRVRAGDTVAIEAEPDGSIRIFPKTLAASDVAGMLKSATKSTIEEMDAAVVEAFRKGKL